MTALQPTLQTPRLLLRPFELKDAPEVKQLAGAWEVAARYSHLTLNNQYLVSQGGQEDGFTFGVNWYLSDHLRLLFNYNYEVPNELNTGTSVANIYGMRLNVFW